MKKVLLYVLIGVIVLGTAGYLFLSGSNSKDMKYRTEKASRGNVVVEVRATGTINPVQTVNIGSQVSGVIQKIYVDYNSTVKKNQVIAQIDSVFLYASVKEAEATLEHARAQVNNNERSLKRENDLFAKNLVAQADLDAAKTAYESSVADFKQAQAGLDRAKVNLQYALIRAPIDGVVISRDVNVGQTVAASFQTPQLFSIANDLKHMQVEASVDEADIGQIDSSESVTFTVDAYTDEQFHGKVSQVRLNPVTVQNVVTYTVIIDVNNPDLKLRPGMTATVSILVAKQENVLRVPALALRFQPPQDVVDKNRDVKSADDSRVSGQQPQSGSQAMNQPSQGAGGGKRQWQGGTDHKQGDQQWKGGGGQKRMLKIWVLDSSKNLHPIMVTVGLNDNRYVEVTSGDLKEGDDVVLGTSGADAAAGGPQQTNPFQTRMPGGGGGGRRGM